MKKLALLSLLLVALQSFNSTAQDVTTTTTTTTTTRSSSSGSERFGKTLNLGVGVGYYGYASRNMPVLHVNYEFDVAKSFTLAPFISYYSYQNDYYWGNKWNSYRNYYYRTTVIPIGVKGTYYFDQLLKANSKWDFYLAGSLGFAVRTVSWENGYEGDKNVSNSPLYLSLHVGAEYHLSQKLGLFLDLSNGSSTFGLAIH